MTTGQVGLTGAQVKALAEFISDNDDGEGIVITAQAAGAIYIGGGLASWLVSADGEVDEQ